ncbi:MAG: hypothetical protein HY530_01430 [Chloroflexi bacterium]|nr:hypothetical protein [Chloroflexota bacterium]
MTVEASDKQPPEEKTTTFTCRFCGQARQLDEMRMLTRFFPPLVVCRECEKVTA